MDFAKIWVLVDHNGREPRQVSEEALGLAESLSTPGKTTIEAVILGSEVAGVAEKLAPAGAQRIVLVDQADLAEYAPETFVGALERLIRESAPDLVLMGHTYQNLDLAPRLAARLGVPLLTDCVGCRPDDSGILFTKQMFRNKLNADVRLAPCFPWMVTLQAGAFSVSSGGGPPAAIETRVINLEGVGPRREVLERVDLGRQKVDLTKAEVIVGVGRGLRKQENLRLVQDLADILGAEIGASRPAVDQEWLERERQIGSSGQTVSPRLYLGVGISGAIQHVVGMRNSGCIVAINSDRNAPIFGISNYGIVGDCEKILPELTAQIRALRKP